MAFSNNLRSVFASFFNRLLKKAGSMGLDNNFYMRVGFLNNYFNNYGSRFSPFLKRLIRLDYVSGLPLLRACASY